MTEYYYILWPLALAAPITSKPGRVALISTSDRVVPTMTRVSAGDIDAQRFFGPRLKEKVHQPLCAAISSQPYGVFRAKRSSGNEYELRWPLEPRS